MLRAHSCLELPLLDSSDEIKDTLDAFLALSPDEQFASIMADAPPPAPAAVELEAEGDEAEPDSSSDHSDL